MDAVKTLSACDAGSNLVGVALDRLLRSAEALLRNMTGKTDGDDHYIALSDHLKTVPLSTPEYATAVQRLKNARQYDIQGETGAAQYEVILLLRGVAKRLEAYVAPPASVAMPGFRPLLQSRGSGFAESGPPRECPP